MESISFSLASSSSPKAQAQNRVIARLLTCVVNEGFLQSHFVQREECRRITGLSSGNHWLCLFDGNHGKQGSFWVPLRGIPALEEVEGVLRVGLLDTDDVAFPVKQQIGSGYVDVVSVRSVMQQLEKWSSLEPAAVEHFTQEIESSVLHLEAAYRRQLRCPLPRLGSSTSIDWEQSIVEGHATHPGNKARFAVAPTLPIHPKDEVGEDDTLSYPSIHFFAVPRDKVTIRGDFEALLSPLLSQLGSYHDPNVEVVVPVHQVQIPNVLAKFPFARHISFTVQARAQASLRTVVPGDLPGLNLKLAIGVITTSAMRTISPWTTYIGPSFKKVADRIVEDKDLLIVCHELASIVSSHENPDVAKHLSCVIREDPDTLVHTRGEKILVSGALTELDPDGEYVVNTVLGLDTAAKKEALFQEYTSLFLKAFLPPLFKHGLTLEAHLQNVLVRFRPELACNEDNSSGQDTHEKWKVTGFMVRDFGGIKVHQPTLFETTGLKVDVWNEEACVLAKDIDDVHLVAYHTIIQSHVHRFARALGVHYNGRGWAFVRQELDRLLPLECKSRQLWLQSPIASWKAFIKMKFCGLYRDYLYTKVTNLINYTPPSIL